MSRKMMPKNTVPAYSPVPPNIGRETTCSMPCSWSSTKARKLSLVFIRDILDPVAVLCAVASRWYATETVLLLQLLVHNFNVRLRIAELRIGRDGVTLVLRRHTVLSRGLAGWFPSFDLLLRPRDEIAVELRVFPQVIPCQHRRMAGDDGVDVFNCRDHSGERVRVRNDAAAVGRVDVGKRFPREHIT